MAGRNLALDLFRGATVALMILVNNPGSWSHLFPPLAHAPWHGCTLTDLVFPFFLFAVGNAMAFNVDRDGRPPGMRRIATRTAWLFGLGLFLNAAPFVRWNEWGELVWRDPQQLRWLGVLQRIALCYCVAALIVRVAPPRAVPAIAAAGLLAYWLLCVTLGATADPWSLDGWFGTALDRALLGESHLYHGEGVPFDPEGLASTLPAAMQVLIGYCAGAQLRVAPRRWRALAFAGAVLLLAAAIWSLAMPLNKKIWTSSYVLYSSGWACLVLAAMTRATDSARGRAAVPEWLVAFGGNALFVFVLSGLLPRALALARWQTDGGGYTTPLRWLHDGLVAPVAAHVTDDPRLASLAYALAMVAGYGALALALRRRGIVIKV